MEHFREFLESSTIHGLVHISTAWNKKTKFLWALIVTAGFSVAGYLIGSSLQDWKSSPISTTITTHPISEAPFPRVTVCPPEGTNTALNYDLMRAESLSNATRTKLKNTATRLLATR